MSRPCLPRIAVLGFAACVLLIDPAPDALFGQANQVGDSSDRAVATSARANAVGEAAGGGAQADFDTLIDLIQATVAPDSWSDVGGDGAIESFPGGVYVDSRGILKTLDRETKAKLLPAWKAIGLRRLARLQSQAVGQESSMRAVSLVKLMNEYQRVAEPIDANRDFDSTEGGRPDYGAAVSLRESMEHVAGLYRLDYLVIDEEHQDVILLGPAGPWRTDEAGRTVNIATGRPVLRLSDWIVLARNSAAASGQFMCAITPTQEGLARAQAFAANAKPLSITVPPNGPIAGADTDRRQRRKTSTQSALHASRDAWLEEFRSALGLQRVEVTGVESTSRVARVLVEADHHMKQIGIGCVRAIDDNSQIIVPSYLDRIVGQGAVPVEMDVLRWWFTLHPEALLMAQPNHVYCFAAQAVQVLSENELLTRVGQRIHTGRSDPENERFAADFTQQFQRLCEPFPIYADLDNLFRLAIAAAVIRDANAHARCDWAWADQVRDSRWSLTNGRPPRWVESIVNHRMVDRRQFVAAVSGGVQFNAASVTAQAPPKSASLRINPALLARPNSTAADDWWWESSAER